MLTLAEQVRGFSPAGLASLRRTLRCLVEQYRSGVIPEQTIIQAEMLYRLCAEPLSLALSHTNVSSLHQTAQLGKTKEQANHVFILPSQLICKEGIAKEFPNPGQ